MMRGQAGRSVRGKIVTLADKAIFDSRSKASRGPVC